MTELLTHLNGGELIGLTAVAGGLLCAIVSVVTTGYFKMRKLALKEAMIQRGMSAEEICAVMEAGSSCAVNKDSKHACQS